MANIDQAGFQQFIVAAGSTRDCQNRRLTETVYVDVNDIVEWVYDFILPECQFLITLGDAEKSVLRLVFFGVFDEGRCWIPLTHWKSIAKFIIRLTGGLRILRHRDPVLAHDLTREDRPVRRGSELRSVVIGRFEEALRGV